VLAASCAKSRPTELVCGNHSDDDDDGKIDCLDPDCHALEACRDFRDVEPPTPDAGAEPPEPPEPPMDSGPPPADPPPDAGPPVMGFVDAGPIVTTPDRDAEPPPECPVCLPTEMCELGACVPVAVAESGVYTLRILAAGAPDMDGTSRCYDDVCEGRILSPPYGFCPCQPDTYVRAVRLRGSEMLVLGMTSVKIDDHAAVFSDPAFDLVLEPGDVLSFEVWDEDNIGTDMMLYECKPDLTMLAAGPISCSARGGPLFVQTLTVRAELISAPQ
jgi:hypothetical protein